MQSSMARPSVSSARLSAPAPAPAPEPPSVPENSMQAAEDVEMLDGAVFSDLDSGP